MPPVPSVDFRRIWPLQATAATLLVAGGLHFTLTPAHGQAEGFTPAELGLIGSAYYFGFLVSSLFNPIAFRALGHRALFCTYAVLIAGSVASQAILDSAAAWIVLRGMVGFLAAGMFTAIESWLHSIATNANRGRTLSAYSIGNQMSLAVGQLLFTLSPAASGAGFYLSAAILLATMIPFATMREEPPSAPARARIRVATLAWNSPVAFVGFIANGLATAPFWVLGPVFARDSGLNQANVALFMALPILGSVILQWPVARLSDGMDRRLVIMPIAFGAALASVAVALAATMGADWAMLVAIVSFGATAFLINMLTSAHMNDRVAPADLTEAAGASFLVYGAASALGPITASFAMQVLGPAGLFWHAAAVLAAFGVFTFTRILVREAPKRPAEQAS